MILYRPVGPAELDLVRQSGWTAFPPRLPHQPIFYAVLDYPYAVEIAGAWNVRESGEGHILRFETDDAFLSNYVLAAVGGKSRREYWIPAEDMDKLNGALMGPIELVATFKAERSASPTSRESE